IIANAAANVIDELLQRHRWRKLVNARPLYMAGDGVQPQTGGALVDPLLEPVGTITQYKWDVDDCLNVVYDSWLRVKSRHRRAGRLQLGMAAVAFKAGDEGCFLAADVRSPAAVHDQIEVLPLNPEDVLAEIALLVCLVDGLLQDLRGLVILAADVDERLFTLQRLATADDAFDECVRALLHQRAVLARARLGLVSVHA